MPATELRLPAPGGGIARLGLLMKRPPLAKSGTQPVLLLHGATFGARLFDLPRAGYSLIEELAGAGLVVYALDFRGYGRSFGFEAMERPSAESPPFGGADAAAEDAAAAVDFILGRERAAGINLVGFSWGSIAAARCAAERADVVSRLVLYAPLYAERNAAWLNHIADPRDSGRLASAFGAYRLISFADVIERWDSELPSGDPLRYREAGVAELIFNALSALDPSAGLHEPRAFRCPNGALADMVKVFNGIPLFDPAKLTMKVLLVRGDEDATSTDSDAAGLLARIASPKKDYRVIPESSHFLCVERNRSKLYEELKRFLYS
jgi:pimeloyl-ACP methyl ester carboxylesterase